MFGSSSPECKESSLGNASPMPYIFSLSKATFQAQRASVCLSFCVFLVHQLSVRPSSSFFLSFFLSFYLSFFLSPSSSARAVSPACFSRGPGENHEKEKKIIFKVVSFADFLLVYHSLPATKDDWCFSLKKAFGYLQSNPIYFRQIFWWHLI